MNGEFQFKKKFGQNFLKNKNMIQKIVSIAKIKEKSLILEVGPGGGALTKELCKSREDVKVFCYEIDQNLKSILEEELKEEKNVVIEYGDFLTKDIKEDIKSFSYKHLYFISNVPYYITTPILFKLISSSLSFEKIIIMVQKEVGDRFTASPSMKQYGALTILLNHKFYIKKEFMVDRNQFEPKPNVDSVVVSFTPKEKILPVIDEEFFQKFVHECFQFKRKTLRNNLKQYDFHVIEEVLKEYHYQENVRAEELPYEVFVRLANLLVKK